MQSSLVLVQAKGIMPACFSLCTAGESNSALTPFLLTSPEQLGIPETGQG